MKNTFKFVVTRNKKSLDFKSDMESPDSWNGDHNAKNNMIDMVQLFMNNKIIFQSYYVQTVANMPGARHTDTIVPGRFYVKWDVERRLFKGHVHGMIGAKDMDGQFVDQDSVQKIPGKNGEPSDWARWIFFHSTLKNDPAPAGQVTRFAWSAGCFIGSPEKQEELFQIGNSNGIKKGQIIPCELLEV